MSPDDPMTPQFTDDERPAPEIVAKLYGFPLAYHDTPDGRFYAVQDWIKGVADPVNLRDFWYALKKRLKRAGFDMSFLCRQLGYRSKDGKTYKIDHANAEGLYLITQRMDASTGIRDEVLKYLAKAGV